MTTGTSFLSRQSSTPPPLAAPQIAPDKVLYGLTIFASAFLLFQVQPLIAKLILPWFGGSAAVWTSCMLFFQLALLGGYAYAHWLGRLPGRNQAAVHCLLLAASLAALGRLEPAEAVEAGRLLSQALTQEKNLQAGDQLVAS